MTMASAEKVCIGISFGTVYSCVSIPGKVSQISAIPSPPTDLQTLYTCQLFPLQNGLSPEVIANEDGHRQIPSFVGFTGYEEVLLL